MNMKFRRVISFLMTVLISIVFSSAVYASTEQNISVVSKVVYDKITDFDLLVEMANLTQETVSTYSLNESENNISVVQNSENLVVTQVVEETLFSNGISEQKLLQDTYTIFGDEGVISPQSYYSQSFDYSDSGGYGSDMIQVVAVSSVEFTAIHDGVTIHSLKVSGGSAKIIHNSNDSPLRLQLELKVYTDFFDEHTFGQRTISLPATNTEYTVASPYSGEFNLSTGSAVMISDIYSTVSGYLFSVECRIDNTIDLTEYIETPGYGNA